LDLEPGTVVANRYRISRPLGRGGMGEVFAAENIRTGRPVAIKLLRQDSKGKSSAVARFRQEARAAGRINSDHVTQVLDVEEDAEHGVVLVFELLEGESLIERLKRTGPIPFAELWPIIEQVWMGLADAHRADIIHRDLKPSNVFLERRPDGSTRVKILDFGISKVPKEVGGETLTEMGQSLGTFSFMPPEQIGKAKTVDHRADIYACATLIYQSLTAQLPYSARNILVMVEMKTKTDARKLSEALAGPIDPRLEAFVARGLSRDPAQRYPTAVDALNVWRDLRPQSPSGAQPPSGQPASSAGPQPATMSAPSANTRVDSSSRPRSQPPPPYVGTNPAAVPRAASAPLIIDGGGALPRVNHDLVELTTDETAATVAMPMPHLKKGPHAQATPPLAPRLGSAAGTLGALQLQQRAPIGPGGTQPVMIGRSLEHLSPREVRPDDVTAEASSKSGNLPAHPAGYYLPPAVQVSLARGPQGATTTSDAKGAASSNLRGDGTELPRAYDNLSSGSSAPPPKSPAEWKEAHRRPTDEAARPSPMDAAMPAPIKSGRGVPLVVVLLGFLMVGFAVVAAAMVLFKR
jgi:serine/threonine protein kinase